MPPIGRNHEASDANVLRALSLFTIALLLSTWPLWRGQAGFPQVPLVSMALGWPAWLDLVASYGLIAALVVTLALARSIPARRAGVVVALLCLATLWLTNQQRLQPWAYHFALAAWLLLVCTAPRSLRWLRLLLVSVYVFSALSKFDACFLQSNGTLFVQTALRLAGLQPVAAGQTLANWAPLLPLGELVTAVMLAVRGLRRWGVISATLLHVALIGLLGPWGLNHRWGVLIWNTSFLVQVWLLFGRAAPTGRQSQATAPPSWCPASWLGRIALLPIVLALVLPLFEPLGIWDSWLCWGLYSKRAAKIEIFLPQDAVDQLPPPLRVFCERTDPQGIWSRLAMDRWSLQVLHAPLYPHERFELGVGLAVLELLPASQRRMMAIRSAPPERRSGRQRTTRWDDVDALRRYAASFRWNALPRANFSQYRATARLPAAPNQVYAQASIQSRRDLIDQPLTQQKKGTK